MHFGAMAPGKGHRGSDRPCGANWPPPRAPTHHLSPHGPAGPNPWVLLKHTGVSQRPLECDHADPPCVPQGQ